MRPLVIANCSGFWGDRRSAALEVLTGRLVDVLTGDYLAELSMYLLAGARGRGRPGWVPVMVEQIEQVLRQCVQSGTRIVVNGGGIDPSGAADAIRDVARRLGVNVAVAHIEGDDLLPHLEDLCRSGHNLANLDTGTDLGDLQGAIVSANAYLGGWGIASALERGADVVVTGRVSDASLVVGSAAWWFGWDKDEWDKLAGATVAGHLLECGAQVTGGNLTHWQQVPGLERPGFPLAEIDEHGGCVITKQAGTGGAVTRDTVTAQLLYETSGPEYLGPDVTTFLNTVLVDDEGDDRVRIHGTRGAPPPDTLKVCVTASAGWRNSMTFVLTGRDPDAKAGLVERALVAALPKGPPTPELSWRLWRAGPGSGGAERQEDASCLLTVLARHVDKTAVDRGFSNACVELALSSYPGFFTTTPPTGATPTGVHWPTLIASNVPEHVVVHTDGERERIVPVPGQARTPLEDQPGQEARWDEPTLRVALGALASARSGDKGGNATLGVWVDGPRSWEWLRTTVTTERLQELVPESRGLVVHRHELPNIRALAFVIVGLLGSGVSEGTRLDGQAKGLGEWLCSRELEVPSALLDKEHGLENRPPAVV